MGFTSSLLSTCFGSVESSSIKLPMLQSLDFNKPMIKSGKSTKDKPAHSGGACAHAFDAAALGPRRIILAQKRQFETLGGSDEGWAVKLERQHRSSHPKHDDM